MQRHGSVIGIRAEMLEEYKALHAAVWPAVLAQIQRSHIRNYTIYLREPENLLFSHFEYHGSNFAQDMERMAEDPETQRWWAVCKPCQIPLGTRKSGEHWAGMEEVFHCD
ncbi:L-rhamnose mutarotase [Verminephrobacter aporrectodeae subsp. tuberculatae]|uniref:L-rhamnose mutarotase n=1 Tax=Verminephrobacter aporrectodeae TaxID=1110389 RepID=UPI002238CD75|nr:L-rhamnose mutarotase [Verminephrobacter aporrectodeae]MCW5223009.1 L-rhamnose mutarotase [Verminephrobacter aporrectodeae subsp. tuberculatae]MCW5256776.1 L-rhamnose mutarotase [Verminephrobacter aporrectodeae subsp. tuberculatae]MCW5288473.1 L-rhamnose mutarotase [Verminephrobacter aporrectodeae subsp. tuberculatae]MCW8166344.1 L-rhamnose mutarotase [Verminephrobacter aporrectodeae subsp. tuberculatae]MCW8170229.1 L-rhamnose mutarotase [Verminephrobacter aporrectodeae subsp. tuberculatae]